MRPQIRSTGRSVGGTTSQESLFALDQFLFHVPVSVQDCLSPVEIKFLPHCERCNPWSCLGLQCSWAVSPPKEALPRGKGSGTGFQPLHAFHWFRGRADHWQFPSPGLTEAVAGVGTTPPPQPAAPSTPSPTRGSAAHRAGSQRLRRQENGIIV